MSDILANPKVKQTLTSVDEKYWYQFGWKVEHHSVTCQKCGALERSTQVYKVFAHYLYTPHTLVTKYLPYNGVPLEGPQTLPIHFVTIASEHSSCAHCVPVDLSFPSDAAYRAHLKEKATEITAAARRDNEMRSIFGGPPARKTTSSAGPKVTLADFMKGMD